MPSTGHHLRPLLPRTPSMTRPEPFLLKTTRNLESDANVNRDSAQVLNPKEAQLQQFDHFKKQTRFEFQRRSAGQRKRRERRIQRKVMVFCLLDKHEPVECRAQNIENLLDIKEHDSQQSRAQKLRRKVEQGERRLRAFPDCDHSRALDEAPDYEWMLNQPRREDRDRESQHKNHNRALFLAFTQHWQFKRTHGLAFVSDYQGVAASKPPTVATFSVNISRYGNFDPMDEDLSIAMSISRSDFPVPSTKGKRKAEEEPEDSRAGLGAGVGLRLEGKCIDLQRLAST
ncbi:hypothetical protein R3P38DRAFT_3355988 [Favolaschia claudopus]|uniref:Uncharacterized protein n=1 Tax=Favolaschia claudopus TaxID=2862362 RepID=A0AAW0BKP3_9AGAR